MFSFLWSCITTTVNFIVNTIVGTVKDFALNFFIEVSQA